VPGQPVKQYPDGGWVAGLKRGIASVIEQREDISGELAWCGPGALAVLLAILATALLTLIIVRLWLKLEKGAWAMLHPVRTCASRSAPGQR
jgi:hypothetical protein